MDPSSVNSFLDQFLALANSGFGLIQGDVTYVLNALIIISIALSGAQWALAQEAPLAPFFRKVLFVGLFAFLINNWNFLATAINQSGAMLGLRAGGDGLSLAELHNPGRVGQIGIELFGRTVALGRGMTIITDFVPLITIYIAAFFVMLGFFVLALQLFVLLIAFKLGSLAAFVALPWGVFNGTAWVAERPLGWVVGSAARLFIIAFVASVAINFVGTLPGTWSLDAGGALQVLFFGLSVLALAWFAPQLASEVVQGQPNLAGGDMVRAGLGVAATAVGGGFVVGQIARPALSVAGAMMGGARRTLAHGHGGGASSSGAIDYARMQPRPKPPSSPPPASSGESKS